MVAKGAQEHPREHWNGLAMRPFRDVLRRTPHFPQNRLARQLPRFTLAEPASYMARRCFSYALRRAQRFTEKPRLRVSLGFAGWSQLLSPSRSRGHVQTPPAHLEWKFPSA